MRRSRMLLGLPALSLAAACAAAPAASTRPTREAACPAELHRPDSEAHADVARVSDDGSRPVAVTTDAPAPPDTIARPLIKPDGRPACGNVMTKRVSRSAAGATTVAAPSPSASVAPVPAIARPRTKADGTPACGNVMTKGGPDLVTAAPSTGAPAAP